MGTSSRERERETVSTNEGFGALRSIDFFLVGEPFFGMEATAQQKCGESRREEWHDEFSLALDLTSLGRLLDEN